MKSKSMETKLIWQYLSSKWPIHCRRTLDQYGYPSLRNTSVRDADQVLYKRTNKSTESEQGPSRESAMQHFSDIIHSARLGHPSARAHSSDGTAKVLMVDQLWLWILDDRKCLHQLKFPTPLDRIEYNAKSIYRNNRDICSIQRER